MIGKINFIIFQYIPIIYFHTGVLAILLCQLFKYFLSPMTSKGIESTKAHIFVKMQHLSNNGKHSQIQFGLK